MKQSVIDHENIARRKMRSKTRDIARIQDFARSRRLEPRLMPYVAIGSSTGRNMSRYSFHIKWQCRHCPRSYEYDTKQMIDELPETVLASSLNHQMACTCTCFNSAIDEFVDIPDCRSCYPQQALFTDIANGEIHRRAVVQNVVSVRSDVG